ncbi:MAG: phospho-N-acetylmuramoyl-pentapeptide-transferase [Candidatus Margulisbacteria bacterium]|jgi:phospho-N-acetylmuramoyl-pentapeptide-transferase|nr:phospho-N-acetylmuramoyl-pentapeptide-transferase [Candidatus Margulisiibacteriota bacterium]
MVQNILSFFWALCISIFSNYLGLQALRVFQFKQTIRECGPARHQAKSGTPVMGGLMIIGSLDLLALLFLPRLSGLPRLTNEVIILLALFTLTGVIGFGDDFLIVRRGKNNGLKPRYKLLGQLIIAALFCAYLLKNGFHQQVSPLLHLVGMNQPVLYVLLASFIVVGVSNAVNLTDGLDGLAAGVSMLVLLAFAFIAWHNFHNPQLAFLALLAAISCLGFLIFNIHPARMFMGDVGSLALGTLLAGFALLLHAELYLALAGLVFVLETLSVILQVGYFRLTGGRRLFKMSPLHHHLELCGWPEKRIVRLAWLVTLLMVGVTVILRSR